jgi:hypothetical protein
MRNKPTVAMKAASKKGIELINSGAFPVTARAEEVGRKIASDQDLDENHLVDMAHFHAAHGGNCPDDDAEDLLWGGPAGGDWARKKMMQNMRTGLAEEELDFNKIISDKDLNLSLEIYSDIQLDEPTEETDDGLIWAPIARSGMLATRPGPNGEKLDQPLIFVPGRSEDQRKEIGLQDIYDSFKDKAIEYVTLPLSHENKVLENTGYIKDLKIIDSAKSPGEKVLMGGHQFTEPDVKGKVERGTIPSRSSGLLYDYKNTTTGKVYPIALDHVCLTPKPWMGGMEPYGSADLGDRTIIPMMLSEKPFTAKPVEKTLPTKLTQEKNTISHREIKKEEIQSEFLADIVWGEKPSFSNIEKQVEDILDHMGGGDMDDYPKYFLLDCTDDKVLIKVNYGVGPDEDAWVVPYNVDKDGNLHLAPFNEWVDSTKKWVTDTLDPDKDKSELDRLGMNEKDKLIASLYLDVTQAERDKAKSNNNSLPDGSYPINNVKQLNSAAILAASKHGDYEAAKRLIRRRAKELGVDVTTLSGFGKKKESSSNMADPLKVASANRLGLSEANNSPLGGSMTLLAMSEEQMELLGLSEEAKEFQRNQNKEIQKISLELAESKKVEKETKTANKIAEYKAEGFDTFPGLLMEYETTALSDDGDIAVKLCLSENGHETTKVETATQIAERFMAAIPRKDNKIDFSEMPNKLESPINERPDLKPEDPNAENKIMTGDDLLERMLSENPNLAKDPEFLALSENGKGK